MQCALCVCMQCVCVCVCVCVCIYAWIELTVMHVRFMKHVEYDMMAIRYVYTEVEE